MNGRRRSDKAEWPRAAVAASAPTLEGGPPTNSKAAAPDAGLRKCATRDRAAAPAPWSRAAKAERCPSADLFRLVQALDERSAQQECPRPRRVLGGAAQLVLIAFAHRGVPLGEQPLVSHGLRLGVLNRDVTPLAFVAVESFLALFATQDIDELVGEVESVVDAAVHSHR